MTHSEEVSIVSSGSSSAKLPFRIFQTMEGRFLRAEYIADGSTDYSTPLDRLERAMRARDEEVLGIVKQKTPASWRDILNKLSSYGSLDGVKRLTITLVQYRLLDRPPAPTFLICVYGAPDMKIDDNSPDDEIYLRIRFLYEANGRWNCADNLL